ncbi:MAG: alpha-L-glutamate ligase [Proteobacteria bacterium]|nr:alpha-L-glutamate ligase [Pseudomonadota bacterium]
MTHDLAVYFEHPRWFEPLWAALDRRGVGYARIPAEGHSFGPDDAAPAPVILNRMAMSAPQRSEGGHPLFYTAALLDHWERLGARVLNGSRPFGYDLSKARQLGLFRSLGLSVPATRVIHRVEDAPAAAAGLRFPVLIKVNIGGSGRGIEKFDTPADLAAAVGDGGLELGVDGVALIQEAAPKRADTITRLETLGGRYLYAIDVRVEGETFDLCPADVCVIGSPVTITRADPAPELIEAAERIAQASGLDVGGVELLIDDRDGVPRFFDFNGMSNFVADAPNLLGFDPHERLVDFLLDQFQARKAA